MANSKFIKVHWFRYVRYYFVDSNEGRNKKTNEQRETL